MMRRLGKWLVETRLGRASFRGITLLFVLGAAYAVIHEEVGRQTQAITKRVEVIERVKPIDVIRECLRTPGCRHLLAHPREVQANSKEVQNLELGGVGRSPTAPTPATSPPSDIKPKAPAGKHQGSKPPKSAGGGGPVPPSAGEIPTAEPAPTPQPASPSAVATGPEPQPGNSGSAPAPEVGVKACVEVVVSACLGAEAPKLAP